MCSYNDPDKDISLYSYPELLAMRETLRAGNLTAKIFDLSEIEEEIDKREDEEDDGPDYDEYEMDDDDDAGMNYSYSQQRAADLSDYANEGLRSGRFDTEQAAEIRAGA